MHSPSSHCQKGQGLVEFAIIVPLILLLLFAVFEFGRAFHTNNVLYHASWTAVRKSAMAPTITEIESTGKAEATRVARQLGVPLSEEDVIVCVPNVTTESCGRASGTIAQDPISVRIDQNFSTNVIDFLPMLVNRMLNEEAFAFYANQDSEDRSGAGRIPGPPNPNPGPPPRNENEIDDGMEGSN